MSNSLDQEWADEFNKSKLDIYKLHKKLGAGGMGAVFWALDTTKSENSPEFNVAIKILRPDASKDSINRFAREAEVMQDLSHQNIITLYEHRCVDDIKSGKKVYFMVMNLVNKSGKTLYDLIYKNKKPLNIETILKIARQIGSALEYVHNKGIIHRDIKPSNILIKYSNTNLDSIVLADFGIASGDKYDKYTMIDQIIGSYPYMAPEIFNYQEHTIQSDIYSFGLVLYEMITGNNPYNDKNETKSSIFNKKQNENLPYIKDISKECPEHMASAIMKAINRDINLRYSSVQEFIKALIGKDQDLTILYNNESRQETAISEPSEFIAPIVISSEKSSFKRYSLGIGIVSLVLIFILLIFNKFGINNSETSGSRFQYPTPNLGAADNLTPTIGDITVAITPSIAVSPSMVASTSTIDLGVTYIEGRTAYAKQDWPNAAAAFDKVLAIDPAYLDLSNIGSATYYNWAVSELTGPDNVAESLEILNKTFSFKPDHQPGGNLAKVLNVYRHGQTAAEQQDWQAAINGYKEAQNAGNAEFGELMGKLQTVKQLYEAYLGRGRELEEAGDTAEANTIYREAAALKDQDSSLDVAAANTGIAATAPTAVPATPTRPAAPVAAPAPQRLYFQKYAENAVDPTCFAVHVRGVNTSGWFVTVDGLGNRGNLDGAGNTNVCGLIASQEVTFTVYNAAGRKVSGGGGIPTRGGDLMAGYWQ